jgi:hypothetical protein
LAIWVMVLSTAVIEQCHSCSLQLRWAFGVLVPVASV